jgi:two-component system sensor histidine kinase VicK
MLHADHSFIARLGEISGDGIAIYDLNSRKFVYTNRYFRQIFNISEDSEIDDGKILLQFMPEEEREHLQERYEELLSIGCISPTEFALKIKSRLSHLSGDVLWLEDSYSMAIFVKDITGIKQHEEYLVKYTAQKDALLDMLIHNLSGPLALSNDVISLIEKKNALPDADISPLVRIIRENTQGCINIVNDFLSREFSDSSMTTLCKSRFDVVQRLTEILDMMRSMENEKQFVLDAPMGSLFINADAVKLLQVFQNLLSNAVKFTGSDGIITVKVSDEEKAFTVHVKDNGSGVPKELQAALFNNKVKGYPGMKGEMSNGMGLFLTHKLVTLMCGSISFETTSKGSVFSVSFPKE